MKIPYITRVLDQKTGEAQILLFRRLLRRGTILSDGVNVARFLVVREPVYVGTVGRDFALEGWSLTEASE